MKRQDLLNILSSKVRPVGEITLSELMATMWELQEAFPAGWNSVANVEEVVIFGYYTQFMLKYRVAYEHPLQLELEAMKFVDVDGRMCDLFQWAKQVSIQATTGHRKWEIWRQAGESYFTLSVTK